MTKMNYFFEDKDVAKDFLMKVTDEIFSDKSYILKMFDDFILNSTFDDGDFEIICTFDDYDILREVTFINHLAGEVKEMKAKKTKKNICKLCILSAIIAGIFFSLGATTRRRNGF